MELHSLKSQNYLVKNVKYLRESKKAIKFDDE